MARTLTWLGSLPSFVWIAVVIWTVPVGHLVQVSLAGLKHVATATRHSLLHILYMHQWVIWSGFWKLMDNMYMHLISYCCTDVERIEMYFSCWKISWYITNTVRNQQNVSSLMNHHVGMGEYFLCNNVTVESGSDSGLPLFHCPCIKWFQLHLDFLYCVLWKCFFWYFVVVSLQEDVNWPLNWHCLAKAS